MGSNLLDGKLEDILHSALSTADGDVFVVNPSGETIATLVEVGVELAAPPTMKVLADETVLRRELEDFIVASNAADLMAAGALELRSVEAPEWNAVLAAEDWLVALVTAGKRNGGIRTEGPEFVEAAYESYAADWNDADEFQLRTPPISRVRESLSSEMGAQTETEFSQVLSSLETARGNGEGLDEVTISLLVAARNEQLFYDISRWGENAGVASKATFSRMKNRLEETGLIGTEKVPVDVGRPRQRLTIEDERLRDASTSQLASVAESILH